jgi:hypothetical protein
MVMWRTLLPFLFVILLCLVESANLKLVLDSGDEDSIIFIKGISLTADASGLYKRIQRQASLPPGSFDVFTENGVKLIESSTLYEQGVTENGQLKLVPRATRSAAASTTTSSSTSVTPVTTSTTPPPSSVNYKILPDTFLQGQNKGQLWHITRKPSSNPRGIVLLQRHLIPSSLVFDQLYGNRSWEEVQTIPDAVLNSIDMGVTETIRNMSFYTTPVLAGPIPIRNDLGIPCDSPFGYGAMAAVSFWYKPWIEEKKNEQPKAISHTNQQRLQQIQQQKQPTHESIFHTLPIQPGVLSPVLLLRNNKLFLGHAAGRNGNNVDLRGHLTDVTFIDREWHHISVLYDPSSSTLQLYHNSILGGTPLRVHDDTFKTSFQKVSDMQRKIIFGSGTILQGATGIIEDVNIHGGHAVNEVYNIYHDRTKQRRTKNEERVNDWLDTVAWVQYQGGIGDDEPTLYDAGMALLSAPPPPPSPTEMVRNELTDGSGETEVTGPSTDANSDNTRSLGGTIGTINDDREFDDWRVRTLSLLKIHATMSHHDALNRKSRMIDDSSSSDSYPVGEMEKVITQSFNTISSSCIYLPTGWWTYELCPRKTVSQKHQEPTKSITVSMGFFNEEKTDQSTIDSSIEMEKDSEMQKGRKKDATDGTVGAEKIMLKEVYTGGSECIVTDAEEKKKLMSENLKRSTTVHYYCCPLLEEKQNQVAGPKLVKVGEPSICNYELTVCVPELCHLPPHLPLPPRSWDQPPKPPTQIIKPTPSPIPARTERSAVDKWLHSPNVARNAVGFSSSIWSQLFAPAMAVDGSKETRWKSHLVSKDAHPWIAFRWTNTCTQGIETMALEWDLSPSAFSVAVASGSNSITNEHSGRTSTYAEEIPNLSWVEVIDVARQATQGRIDIIDDIDSIQNINWINVSIQHAGSWTAPSLVEMTIMCTESDSNSDSNSGSGSVGEIETMVAVEPNGQTSNIDAVGPASASDAAADVGDSSFSNSLIGLDNVIEAMKNGGVTTGGNGGGGGSEVYGYSRDYHKGIAAFALQVLINQRSKINEESGAFLSIANHHYNGHPLDYMERLLKMSNVTYATTPYKTNRASCSASSALYWHEAKKAVGGGSENGVHPTPIQELQLSTADKETMDRHRGDSSDEGTYQQSAADAGDVSAQKWIATRFYHGKENILF